MSIDTQALFQILHGMCGRCRVALGFPIPARPTPSSCDLCDVAGHAPGKEKNDLGLGNGPSSLPPHAYRRGEGE